MSKTERTLRCGIVSDTHGQVLFAQGAVRMLDSLEVDRVIHCGDIGSPDIVGLFSPWPTHFVFGNVDSDEQRLRQTIEACGQYCHGRFGTLHLAGVDIAFLHGDDQRRLAQTISGGKYHLVCYGHTHVARQHREGHTLALNPGALYRANPHTIAVVELPGLQVTSIVV